MFLLWTVQKRIAEFLGLLTAPTPVNFPPCTAVCRKLPIWIPINHSDYLYKLFLNIF